MTDSILTISQKLMALTPTTKADVENIVGIALDLEQSHSDENLNIFKGKNKMGDWQSIELRLPKGLGGTLLVLELAPEMTDGPAIVQKFGQPLEPRQPFVGPQQQPAGETVMKFRFNGKTMTWIFTKDDKAKTLIITDGR